MDVKELRVMAARALQYAAEIKDAAVAARFKLMAADLMAQTDAAVPTQQQQQIQPDKKDE